MLKKKYNLHSAKTIERWDEAMPVGNGKLGCLIYGNGKLRISLDRCAPGGCAGLGEATQESPAVKSGAGKI